RAVPYAPRRERGAHRGAGVHGCAVSAVRPRVHPGGSMVPQHTADRWTAGLHRCRGGGVLHERRPAGPSPAEVAHAAVPPEPRRRGGRRRLSALAAGAWRAAADTDEPLRGDNRMNVGQLMRRQLRTCRREDSLNVAAQIMWEEDCGCVPVVEEANLERPRLVGILTDRDICMAAYTQGRPLDAIQVQSIMERDLATCVPTDPV